MTTFNGIPTDPDRNVTVTCGSTEGMLSALLAIINPGDEIIIFEPFYENYGPDTHHFWRETRLSGIAREHPQLMALSVLPTMMLNFKPAFSPNTKAIVINTPNNPLGKVFTIDELQQIADLCL